MYLLAVISSDCVMLILWVSLMTLWHQADVLITTVRPMTSCERIKLAANRNGEEFLWLRFRRGEVSASSLCERLALKADA